MELLLLWLLLLLWYSLRESRVGVDEVTNASAWNSCCCGCCCCCGGGGGGGDDVGEHAVLALALAPLAVLSIIIIAQF